jgi:hypothetical protein
MSGTRPSVWLFLVLILSRFGSLAFGDLPHAAAETGPTRAALRFPQEPVGSAEWVARQVDNRDTGRDGRFTWKMRLVDRHGRARSRELQLLTLRGAVSPSSAAPAGEAREAQRQVARSDGDRLLIRFTYPDDIKGTSFLVWERPQAEDERFLYLPALGRVRRIAGAETQESFVGTDFTYEDIGGREFDDYTYALLDERAAWTGPDGKVHPAYKLESRARARDVTYPRVESLIRKDNFVVVHADIFNRRGERHKVFDVRRLEPVQSIWTVLEMQMANELDRTRTELTVTSAEYNVGLTEGDFTRRELERGAR